MTFLSHETTREAQAVRRNKDERGRRGRYATPDRPGTNLAYSQTGKGNGAPRTALAAALSGVDLPDDLKPKSKSPKGAQKRKPQRAKRKPAKGAGSVVVNVHPSAQTASAPGKGNGPVSPGAAAAAMRRMASRKA